MDKRILTKQDIKFHLISKLNKRKAVAIWLTIYLFVSIICYIEYLVCYANGIILKPRNFRDVNPTVVIIIGLFIILFFIVFLFRYYYSMLYKIKKGKFTIIKENLSKKENEIKYYYRRSEEEKVLYFPYGRIAVEDEVYNYSSKEDSFYLVILKASKVPFVVYHTSHFAINDNL